MTTIPAADGGTRHDTGRDPVPDPAAAARLDTIVARLVADLTLDEKAALTAGVDMWTTAAVPRLEIPAVRLTDGPSGARGTEMGPAGPRACCVPCGSALGATWSPEVLGAVGAVLGREARDKGARVLLAPTVNMHRSPLAGRNFECYSEDPLLAGLLAAAFVRSAQAQGVATTVKHLVANDAEHQRYTMSSDVDERALREIYLRPFELAVRKGGTLGVMTSYNRLNGRWCTERPDLLGGILRDEWGFDGFVVTDWFAVATTAASARAGVDLEMPGPGRAFGPALAAAVRAGEVDEAAVDAQVTRLLGVLARLGALEDDGPGPETGVDRPEHRAVARRAATESMVLLANDGLLPLDRAALRTVAVIGPNADRAQIMGGGSASLRAHHLVTPREALVAALGDGVTVVHEPGCDNRRLVPPLGGTGVVDPDGTPGFHVDWFANPDLAGPPAHTSQVPEADIFTFEPPRGLVRTGWSLRAYATLTPEVTGEHLFTLVQSGRGRLQIAGEVVIDGVASPPPRGTAWFGVGSQEARATVALTAGQPCDVVLELSTGEGRGHGGLRIGHRPPEPPDLLERAVSAAAAADAVVLVVGTTGEWESEGDDRPTMDLPGRQDELVRRVLAANPATVVVVNAASPVTMDWAPEARALLQIWFGGQEMAAALADVLLGAAEPAGRLPMTLPLRLEHNPSFGNFPGENGHVAYAEGVLAGYRWYTARHLPVRFPFGHGGSYTTFALGPPAVSSPTVSAGDPRPLTVTVPVTNTGGRRGAEVVQCYVAPPPGRLTRPPRSLAGFAKVWLDPGETATVALEIDERALAYWDPGQPDRAEVADKAASVPMAGGRGPAPEPGWRVDPGPHELHVGTSVAAIRHVVTVDVVA
ncbi:MAG TPA: glycoside hydrolase family 3 C-terminal domain-containing protein [Acidimicrobiales bacterium]|nr:glycoside hydrolase family 3 C-terminal domain-containing protein [Acidimicrobiales bacterium]